MWTNGYIGFGLVDLFGADVVDQMGVDVVKLDVGHYPMDRQTDPQTHPNQYVPSTSVCTARSCDES